MNLNETAGYVNILGEFCGRRDVAALTSDKLTEKYGFNQADVMVLFGGSILYGGDVLAEAMRRRVAKKYIIAGGAGHTTETLREEARMELPGLETAGLPEAKVFAGYLKLKYDLEPDYLEYTSTNCGNNITYMLDLINDNHIPFRSVILCQDAAMQLRMDAGLRKHCLDTIIINYAAYSARVMAADGKLVYEKAIRGMWDVERYISLLMGEIPRLTDGVDGYGPKGKGYIAHVEIPQGVQEAFDFLKNDFGYLIRKTEFKLR